MSNDVGIRRIFYLLVFCLGFSASAYSKDSIRLATFYIPLLVESGQKGVFIDLSRRIASDTGTTLEFEFLPVNRALLQFRLGNVDGVFPALDIFFPDYGFVRTQELITEKKDYIFSKVDKPLYRSIKELENLSVGVTLGYPYAQALMNNPKIRLTVSRSDEINAQMLMRDRFDAFIAEERTGLIAFGDAETLAKIHYDPTSPIVNLEVFYAFQKNALGKELAEIFDAALSSLRKSGEYDRIVERANAGIKMYQQVH